MIILYVQDQKCARSKMCKTKNVQDQNLVSYRTKRGHGKFVCVV